MTLTVAMPFFVGDVAQLHALLEWCIAIGGCKNHDGLLVADAATPFPLCAKAKKLADKCFREVKCISNANPVTGWPMGPNSLFFAAAHYIENHVKQPWLLLETDAVPLKSGWLDEIAAEYKNDGRIMGDIYSGTHTVSQQPIKAMSGIAVYPDNAASQLKDDHKNPWDMANREYMLANGQPTTLIKHFYGEKKLPPTFVKDKGPVSPRNSFTLEQIPAQAVLWHRNKDGTLINLLYAKHRIPRAKHAFNMIFPVCNKDAHLLKANLEWMMELDGQNDFTAFMAFDPTLDKRWQRDLTALGRNAFKEWTEVTYPAPKHTNWPWAPNHAFQCCARYAKTTGRSWFWYEADAWPLRSGWLSILETEYVTHGKELMGPIVPDMGHLNGVAIYPWNFCDISKIAMTATDAAWDAVCKPDIQGRVHDAGHLMCHIWGIGNGMFTPYHGSGSPTFPDAERLKWIPGTAILVHRVKDTTLVQRLRERKNNQNV